VNTVNNNRPKKLSKKESLKRLKQAYEIHKILESLSTPLRKVDK
jgi:hypothetical protein